MWRWTRARAFVADLRSKAERARRLAGHLEAYEASVSERAMWICYYRGRLRGPIWHLVLMSSIESKYPLVATLCNVTLERERFGTKKSKRLCRNCAAFAARNSLRPPWQGRGAYRIET